MTTVGKAYPKFKNMRAEGVAIDEAGNMNRADLACVWGNTLIPCFLGGDARQLPPTVMTGKEKDGSGNFYHRLADDGKISPLEFFQASGMPVFRLHEQLRMGVGLFDWVAAEVYPEVPFRYGSVCDISLPKFAAGVALEEYIAQKWPKIRQPQKGNFLPVFLHCQDSVVHVDEMTGSKSCPRQAEVALEFATDFVVKKKGNSSRLVMLTPYAANVELITKMRRHPQYSALSAMPPASTVDGFQGKEGDIVIVVMGTSAKSGPGFTCDPQRLNVMLTRHRCGLVIVGDINVCGKVDAPGGGAKVKTINAEGEEVEFSALFLKNIYGRLYKSGRVVFKP